MRMKLLSPHAAHKGHKRTKNKGLPFAPRRCGPTGGTKSAAVDRERKTEPRGRPPILCASSPPRVICSPRCLECVDKVTAVGGQHFPGWTNDNLGRCRARRRCRERHCSSKGAAAIRKGPSSEAHSRRYATVAGVAHNRGESRPGTEWPDDETRPVEEEADPLFISSPFVWARRKASRRGRPLRQKARLALTRWPAATPR